jgi:hypothetical protein
MDSDNSKRLEWLKKELIKMSAKDVIKTHDLSSTSIKMYEKGYSGMDIIYILEKMQKQPPNPLSIPEEKLSELLFTFHKVRREFRSDKLFILFILNFLFLSLDYSLENISFI